MDNKRLRYFFTGTENISEDKLFLTEGEVHHLRDVIRLEENNECNVLDGQGNIYHVRILSISKNKVVCSILDKVVAIKPSVQITLAQALPKGRKFDFIVEKATELGIEKIIPIEVERSVQSYKVDRFAKVYARWQTISLQAMKQSLRPYYLEIEYPMSFSKLETILGDYDLVIFPVPGAEIYIDLQVQETLKTCRIKRVLLIIGPEGGFDEREISVLIKKGAKPVSLGELVLRTETASVACMSFLKFILQTREK